MNTKTDLVQELRNRMPKGNTSITKDLEEIIWNADNGEYHDFESSQATPKMNLVRDLRKIGFEDLARKVIQGDYDEPMP